RFNEKARVRFLGLEYLVIATEFAGRKASLIILKKSIMLAIPSNVGKSGISRNNGALKNRLKLWTRYSPNRSVKYPPAHDPITEPTPKKLNTMPACTILNPR